MISGGLFLTFALLLAPISNFSIFCSKTLAKPELLIWFVLYLHCLFIFFLFQQSPSLTGDTRWTTSFGSEIFYMARRWQGIYNDTEKIILRPWRTVMILMAKLWIEDESLVQQCWKAFHALCMTPFSFCFHTNSLKITLNRTHNNLGSSP